MKLFAIIALAFAATTPALANNEPVYNCGPGMELVWDGHTGSYVCVYKDNSANQ